MSRLTFTIRTSDPALPNAGQVSLYAKGSYLYYEDSAGIVTQINVGSAGAPTLANIATNSITTANQTFKLKLATQVLFTDTDDTTILAIVQSSKSINIPYGALSVGTAYIGNTRLSIEANTTSLSSIHLFASSAVDVSAPSSGDLWWNGTNLYFYNGTTNKDLLAAPSAITTLNTLTASTQTFATGTTGTDFGIVSGTSTHTFNLPTASATNRGLLSTSDWSAFNGKVSSQWTTSGAYIYHNDPVIIASSSITGMAATLQIGNNDGTTFNDFRICIASAENTDATKIGGGMSFYAQEHVTPSTITTQIIKFTHRSEAGTGRGGYSQITSSKSSGVDKSDLKFYYGDAVNSSAEGFSLTDTGTFKINNLAGTNTRLVTTSSTGLLSASAYSIPTTDGTSGQALITNGSNVASWGVPTVNLIDTNASHYLNIVAGSDLTANRTLTLTTGDANLNVNMSYLDFTSSGQAQLNKPTIPSSFPPQYYSAISNLTNQTPKYYMINVTKACVLTSIVLGCGNVASGSTLVGSVHNYTLSGAITQYSSERAAATVTAVGDVAITFSNPVALAIGKYFIGILNNGGNSEFLIGYNNNSSTYIAFDGAGSQTTIPSTESTRTGTGSIPYMEFK